MALSADKGPGPGTIATSQPADDLARLLPGTLAGIRVLARARPEPALLAGLVRPVFALLDGPSVTRKRPAARRRQRRGK
jgi:TetR/AcrR family transcriptional repressor of nem operon